jgi:hypothetical protein
VKNLDISESVFSTSFRYQLDYNDHIFGLGS